MTNYQYIRVVFCKSKQPLKKFPMTTQRLRLEMEVEVELWKSYIGSTDLNTLTLVRCNTRSTFYWLQISDLFIQVLNRRNKENYSCARCLFCYTQSSVGKKPRWFKLTQHNNCLALRQKRRVNWLRGWRALYQGLLRFVLQITTMRMWEIHVKTLPEAQRTPGIDSLTWVISPAK